jgi:CBS domain-containing protein
MASGENGFDWEKVIKWVVATGIFVLILLVGSHLTSETIVEQTTTPGADQRTETTEYNLTPELVFAALVPLLSALVIWDKLSEIGGSTVNLKFKSTSPDFTKEELIAPRIYTREREVEQSGPLYRYSEPGSDNLTVLDIIERTKERQKKKPKILSLKIDGMYTDELLWVYATEYKDLKYIQFRNEEGEFKGLMSISDFWTALGAYRGTPLEGGWELEADFYEGRGLSTIINNGAITEHNLVITEPLPLWVTNEQALREMNRRDIDVAPLVEDNEFKGVVSRESILSSLHSIGESKSKKKSNEADGEK